jgi:hypothetical protein
MSEDAQRRLQNKADEMLSSLDREILRPLQKSAYLKMAGCLDNNSASQEQVQRCMERQQHLLQSAQNVVQGQMQQFQQRLQRCAQMCQDEVQDQIEPGMDRDSAKFRKLETKVNNCMGVCVDKHIALLNTSVHSKIKMDLEDLLKQSKA